MFASNFTPSGYQGTPAQKGRPCGGFSFHLKSSFDEFGMLFAEEQTDG
jgi:hypothetical protein